MSIPKSCLLLLLATSIAEWSHGWHEGQGPGPWIQDSVPSFSDWSCQGRWLHQHCWLYAHQCGWLCTKLSQLEDLYAIKSITLQYIVYGMLLPLPFDRGKTNSSLSPSCHHAGSFANPIKPFSSKLAASIPTHIKSIGRSLVSCDPLLTILWPWDTVFLREQYFIPFWRPNLPIYPCFCLLYCTLGMS